MAYVSTCRFEAPLPPPPTFLFAPGASNLCLVGENRACSVLPLYYRNARVSRPYACQIEYPPPPSPPPPSSLPILNLSHTHLHPHPSPPPSRLSSSPTWAREPWTFYWMRASCLRRWSSRNWTPPWPAWEGRPGRARRAGQGGTWERRWELHRGRRILLRGEW